MLYVYFLAHPIMWAIPWILQSLGYFFILKKMGLRQWTAIIPALAEREFCTVLMRRMRTFYRPFIITVVLIVAAYYLGPYAGLGRLYMIAAFIIYGCFMLRLYWRLSKAFQKSIPFYIGMVLIAPVFLLILGLGKSEYHPLKLEPIPTYGKVQTLIRRVAFGLVSAVELAALVGGVGFITNQKMMFPFLVQSLIQEVEADYSKIDIKDSYVSNTDVVDQAVLDSLEPSREHFFTDHSNDKSVVVYTYVVGSDLEGNMGLCTINLNQMMEATKQGSNLKFVLEMGGAKRWFTKGVEDGSYGRYVIENGTITKVQDLPSTTNLSEGKELEDFLKWGKENYSADRQMLVLWDHGGGFTLGYGSDDVNKTKEMNIMSPTEIVSAVESSGIKFDVIGFDACLMQDIEMAALLEPYTDYFLASEEVEGGLGWYYTPAFGKLAKDPGIDSEKFFKEMMSSYDAYNIVFSDGEGPKMNTLSVVDTTLAKPAYEKMDDLWTKSSQAIEEDPKAFAYISTAANNAYTFEDKNAIDLIGYLNVLENVDLDNLIYSDEEYENLKNSVQASVIYRNENTFDGINGIAVTFPYNNMRYYKYSYDQMKNFSLEEESSMMNKFFSIIAYKQTEQHNAKEQVEFSDVLHDLSHFQQWVEDLVFVDYTKEDWYEAGFENYDTTPLIIDVPLEETETGYKINIPENAWDIMLDCRTSVYKLNDDGSTVYLGSDYIGEDDENGHPMVDFDGNWVHINGQLICYEAQGVRESEKTKSSVFYGQVPAMLNGDTEILLNIEWESTGSSDEMPTGKVIGYELPKTNSGTGILEPKGPLTLKAGDSLQFMFQTYDESGKLVGTKPSGKKIYVTKQDRLTVEDSKVDSGTYQFNAILTDIYKRTFTSEMINVTIK